MRSSRAPSPRPSERASSRRRSWRARSRARWPPRRPRRATDDRSCRPRRVAAGVGRSGRTCRRRRCARRGSSEAHRGGRGRAVARGARRGCGRMAARSPAPTGRRSSRVGGAGSHLRPRRALHSRPPAHGGHRAAPTRPPCRSPRCRARSARTRPRRAPRRQRGSERLSRRAAPAPAPGDDAGRRRRSPLRRAASAEEGRQERGPLTAAGSTIPIRLATMRELGEASLHPSLLALAAAATRQRCRAACGARRPGVGREGPVHARPRAPYAGRLRGRGAALPQGGRALPRRASGACATWPSARSRSGTSPRRGARGSI